MSTFDQLLWQWFSVSIVDNPCLVWQFVGDAPINSPTEIDELWITDEAERFTEGYLNKIITNTNIEKNRYEFEKKNQTFNGISFVIYRKWRSFGECNVAFATWQQFIRWFHIGLALISWFAYTTLRLLQWHCRHVRCIRKCSGICWLAICLLDYCIEHHSTQ